MESPDGLCVRCLFEMAAAHPGLARDRDACTAARSLIIRYFGDYEVLEELGCGGMGVVFRACQHSLGRFVALKLMSTALPASEEWVEQFKTEARAAAALDHRNIVSIHEIGEFEGQHYFSMKLVEGPSLAEALEGRPMPNRGAARLLVKLARAVDYAHQRGVLHRDIKPANVLMDDSGEPHLTDFGLAKIATNGIRTSPPTTSAGTPNYMAPEEACGGTRRLTTGVDIYGLGTVLYEMLTGLPPFTGVTPLETARHVIENEPQGPSTLNGRVNRDLEAICLRCLEKDPAARYTSADALAKDLEGWLRGEPILARRAGIPKRLWLWVRRKPELTGLIVTWLLGAGAGLAAMLG